MLPKDLSFPPLSPMYVSLPHICVCVHACMYVCVGGGGGGGGGGAVRACMHARTCSVGMLISGRKLQLWAHIKQISDLLT